MSTRSAKAAQEAAVAAIAAAAAATAAADRATAAAAQKGLRQEGDDMEVDNPIVDVAAAMQTPAVQAEMARQLAVALAAHQPAVNQPGGQQAADAGVRASPVSSPQLSPSASPRQMPMPKLSEIPEYAGAHGQKLDEWLEKLAVLAEFHEMPGPYAVKYGSARLTGAARLWWTSLTVGTRSAITDGATLAAALRARFQPVSAERTARAEFRDLQQGQRGVDAFIADFQRLSALLPSTSEEDKLYQFEQGLRRDLAEKLRVHGITKLDEAIAMAARVGNLMESVSGRPPVVGNTHPARLQQMEDGNASDDRLTRMEATLHAMAAAANFGPEGPTGGYKGLGAKMQTNLGYQQQRRGGGGGRGGGPSSTPGRTPRPAPSIPGVPQEVAQRRWDEKLCLRCGSSDHMSMTCPNPIKSSN